MAAGTKAIGFRAEVLALSWAVVEGTAALPILVDADVLKAPKTYDEASRLKWFREKINLLLDTYSPDIAAVRAPETFNRHPQLGALYERCRVEGVAIESIASRGIAVVVGPSATISSGLGTKSVKHYFEGDDLRGLDWRKHKGYKREAILAAASALA